MSWWGKLAGSGIGFVLGGPLGGMLGAVLGHEIDKINQVRRDAGPDSQERAQAAFFTAVFSVMGHIAKADGRVTQVEIQAAERVFSLMDFNPQQRATAIQLFNQGKQDNFDLPAVLAQFKSECGHNITLMQIFVQIQLQAAYADGNKHPAEELILKEICKYLGYPLAMLSRLEAVLFAAQQQQYSAGPNNEPNQGQIDMAYSVLGVDARADDADIKKAYRRLMSQHHPDKLISKGLPEEMIQVATDQSQEIQKAYETVKKARKSR